jgi:hypothetical protein
MPTTDSKTDSSGSLKSVPSSTASGRDDVVRLLTTFYGIMGHIPEEDGALVGMATALCADHSLEIIELAMNRCMRECQFPVRLPDIFLRIPGAEVPKIEAEMRAAWDVLIKFVNKWCRWNDGYFDAHVEQGAPKLPQRITDTVRRTGGWRVYLRMESSDFPHQQKRFFEEYQAWTAVERVLPDLEKQIFLLPASSLQQLAAPNSENADGAARDVRDMQNAEAATNAKIVKPFPAPRKVPEPMTSEQLRDRREMLRQQIETLKAKRAQPAEAPESRLLIHTCRNRRRHKTGNRSATPSS